ncbi:hypothetical protein TC_0126 [Chlamydia muridarum str. Nigg]|uniref:Uncharacterized protein n=1 Tax=Chlamydia muridarum (strain MoPn / Nigg) TaxID=243161 RepID=Q9PLH4_CHLMU|nr:hypothetical protein TC_0126 [Chlamydia muridarum str. Nigg]
MSLLNILFFSTSRLGLWTNLLALGFLLENRFFIVTS